MNQPVGRDLQLIDLEPASETIFVNNTCVVFIFVVGYTRIDQ